MGKVQARTLKGFRDYLPASDIGRQRMLRTVSEVFESFGFGPLTTPAIEYADILLGKYGEEGDKLLYRFQDNGGRDVALRYDLTVPLARVVAQHRDLEIPFRRYQVAPVWRAEKPGKGRYREFLQCDVDIIGEAGMSADAECMMVGMEVLLALGVPDFEARVNNRKILDGLMDYLEVQGEDTRRAVLRAVDKLPKIGREGVERELQNDGGLADKAMGFLFDFMEMKIEGPDDVLLLAEKLPGSEPAQQGAQELAELLGLVAQAGYEQSVAVDLSIARGLDYYTGTIYETFVRGNEDFGSVMSGGRYDTLLELFLKQSIPAVGICLGIDRLLALLQAVDRVEEKAGVADIYVALFDEDSRVPMVQLAQTLRREGLKVEMSLQPSRLGKQFRFAERKGYRWVVFAGADERATNHVVLKDLDNGEQQRVAPGELLDIVR